VGREAHRDRDRDGEEHEDHETDEGSPESGAAVAAQYTAVKLGFLPLLLLLA
jgi:hypothetical protein